MDLVEDTVNRLLADHCSPEAVSAAAGGWSEELWSLLDDVGLTRVGLPEELDGAGTRADAATVVRLAARAAAPVPLADSAVIAGTILARCAAEFKGPYAPALAAPGAVEYHEQSGTLAGELANVVWAPVAQELIVVIPGVDGCGDVVLAVDRSSCSIQISTNIADEPLGTVCLDGVPARLLDEGPESYRAALACGAAVRSLQIAGACEAIVARTINYANERIQFGRSLGRFQAIQQYVARMAAETVAARRAADEAFALIGLQAGPRAAAAAKIRCGSAGTCVARLSHQVHGAMGFTQEYPLHLLSRRVWNWREEYGSEAYWRSRLGAELVGDGAEMLWPAVTSTVSYLGAAACSETERLSS